MKYLILFLLLEAGILLGQERPEVIWSKDMRAPVSSAIDEIVGVAPGGFYALRIQESFRNRPYLEWYNAQFDLERFVELDLRYLKTGQYRLLEKVLYTGEGLFSITSYTDVPKWESQLLLERIDRKTLEPDGDLRTLMQISLAQDNGEVSYHVSLSVDSSKVLICAETLETEREQKTYWFQVFDAAMEHKLWEKTCVIPVQANLADTEALQVDDLGNVYLIARHYFDKRVDRRKGRPNYEFRVLSLRTLGQDSSQAAVHVRDCFVNDLALKIAPNGTPVCVGLYSHHASRTSVRGALLLDLTIADTTGVDPIHLVPLDSAFLARFMKPRKAGKGRELTEFDLHDCIVRLDGGVVVLAEQVYVRASQNNPAPVNISYVPQLQYFYNDIIVISISPAATMEWSAQIPKRQETTNDEGYYSSFALAAAGDKLYFLYNDHIRNLAISNPAKMRTFNGRKSMVMLTTIDATGRVVREPLFSNREQRILTRPKIVHQMTSNMIMLYGEFGRRYKFGRIMIGK